MIRFEDLPPEIQARVAKIRGLTLDVDGVLTHGQIVYDDRGVETKSFHVHDGLGIKSLLDGGMPVAIISGRSSEAVSLRARELGIEHIYQGSSDKLDALKDFCRATGLNAHSIAHIGDDIPDLVLLGNVGLLVAVPNAIEEVRSSADLITTKSGGNGAVREFCDLLVSVHKH